MGADYHSYSVLGVEIDPEKLYTKKTQRACSCDIECYKDTPPKFCTNCGNPFLETVKWPIDGWDEDKDFRGLKIVFGTDRERAYVSLDRFICHESDYSKPKVAFVQITPNDLKELKEELRTTLGEEFWDEEKFGLYSVLYCSY